MIETVTIALALILIAYFSVQLVFGHLSQKWPTTKGTLTSFNQTEWKTYSKFPSIQGIGKACHIKIKYKYSHGKNCYEGGRIGFGKDIKYLTPEEIESDKFIQKIKTDNFTVYYWDRFPQISTLKVGIQNKNDHIFAIIFTLFMASIVLGLAHVF